MDYTLRFWAENIKPDDVLNRGLPYLQSYRAGVAIALREEDLNEECAIALRGLEEARVSVSFWPLLSLEIGYFPCERNFLDYISFVEKVLAWAQNAGVSPDVIAVDLELPFSQVVEILKAGKLKIVPKTFGILRENLSSSRFKQAHSAFAELQGFVRSRGIRVLTAVLPWVLLELDGSFDLIQDMMETPVFGIDWDIISPMFYVSMISGMSGGFVNERDANWLTYKACCELADRFSEKAGVSLGVTGTGILGNEPSFDTPERLVIGIEAALAAGITDISIYNLEGILEREDPEHWFDLIRSAKPRIPPESRKISAALQIGRKTYPFIARFIKRFSRG